MGRLSLGRRSASWLGCFWRGRNDPFLDRYRTDPCRARGYPDGPARMSPLLPRTALGIAAMPSRIAVVIPCFRVRHHVTEVIARIGAECDSIFVVDDCCPENSGRD